MFEPFQGVLPFWVISNLFILLLLVYTTQVYISRVTDIHIYRVITIVKPGTEKHSQKEINFPLKQTISVWNNLRLKKTRTINKKTSTKDFFWQK